MSQNGSGNQGFTIPAAVPQSQSNTTQTTEQPTIPLSPAGTDSARGENQGQVLAIAAVFLSVWVIAAFFFRRKWAISFKEKRVSENNAEASSWAFFGALTACGVGAALSFISEYAKASFLIPVFGVSLVLFVLAFVMARK